MATSVTTWLCISELHAQLLVMLAQLLVMLAQLLVTLAQLLVTLAQLLVTLAQLLVTLAQLLVTLTQLLVTLTQLLVMHADSVTMRLCDSEPHPRLLDMHGNLVHHVALNFRAACPDFGRIR